MYLSLNEVPDETCNWTIFTESTTVSLHITGDQNEANKSLEIPLSGINLTALGTLLSIFYAYF